MNFSFNFNNKNTLLIVVFIGLLVFSNSLFNGFVWDDEEQIVNNSVIRDLRNIPVIFSGGAFNSGGTGSLLGIYYKPMMTLAFALTYSVFKLNPFFYHLTSVLLQITNSYLVYLFLSKFFNKNKALILSLLFMVHPLYSEVVFYMADIQDLLYFLFGMLGLLISSYWSVLFFLLSLLSKETGIVFILISIIYSYLFQRKKIIQVVVPGVIAILIYSFLRFYVAKIYFPRHDMAPIARLTLKERVKSMPLITFYYLENFVLPINLTINQHWYVK
jgi:hypothetical protein